MLEFPNSGGFLGNGQSSATGEIPRETLNKVSLSTGNLE